MINKFKVGDRVLVHKIEGEDQVDLIEYEYFINKTGKVTCVDELQRYPYQVTFRKRFDWFGENELVLYSKAAKVLYGKR